jgi:hypothetical protein
MCSLKYFSSSETLTHTYREREREKELKFILHVCHTHCRKLQKIVAMGSNVFERRDSDGRRNFERLRQARRKLTRTYKHREKERDREKLT